MVFEIGQCWMSEAEPELGIGFIRLVDGMAVEVEYPAGKMTRRYNIRTAPLRRLEFRIGEVVRDLQGATFEVKRVEIRARLNWYHGGAGQLLCETEISPAHRLQRPLERFLSGQVDPLGAYRLRKQSMDYRGSWLKSRTRGLIGPRVMLLPHQAYVVSQVAGRGFPRALLADEVGLGKTIEAGWILHQLHTTERVRRVLLLVPQALVNQWFVEMLRRFNLAFWVPESQSEEDGIVVGDDLGDHERFIFALESLEDPEFCESLLDLQWDLIVVDEAHRVDWSPEEPSAEYEILEALSKKTRGLLLLTATPEQLGLEGHFGRLRLVDPQRFSSWEAFQKEHGRYLEIVRLTESLASEAKIDAPTKKEIAKLVKGKLAAGWEDLDTPEKRRLVLSTLVDHYGTGRIYFRNSRKVVEIEHFSFPKRLLHKHLISAPSEGKRESEVREDALVAWLAEFSKNNPNDKILLIAATARLVVKLKERLLNEHAVKAVEFHEGQALLVRDRNAAFFEDPDGARILLCSEIGGEGRNFQHAKHLILADLPIEPDVLEQRIGRLDRIGQRNDVQVHVPYLEGGREIVLTRWYDEVFDAFRKPASGAGKVHDQFFEKLEKFLLKPQTAKGKAFESVLEEAAQAYAETLKQIEGGRDRLIEINSFDPRAGMDLVANIAQTEDGAGLKVFLESIFDGMGIHVENIDATTLFVEPGDTMFTSYFPGLPAEGMLMSFSREKALTRDDITLMTWDHPLVAGTLEAILSQEFGNVSAARWEKVTKATPPMVLEVCFQLECLVDPQWYGDEFFPTAPLRVVLDGKTGKDVSDEWPA
ncbi:RNA polymerase-associated protein RapA, partial [bacterium]|nr:RNA polymerase-associated protein RapA [bacterium]